jgi:hypothetical protein
MILKSHGAKIVMEDVTLYGPHIKAWGLKFQ